MFLRWVNVVVTICFLCRKKSLLDILCITLWICQKFNAVNKTEILPHFQFRYHGASAI